MGAWWREGTRRREREGVGGRRDGEGVRGVAGAQQRGGQLGGEGGGREGGKGVAGNSRRGQREGDSQGCSGDTSFYVGC